MKFNLVKKYIKSDLYRYTGSTSAMTFIIRWLMDSTFNFQTALRLCRCDGIVGLMGKILYYLNPQRRSIQIRPETKIGFGLYIGHGGPLTVNHNAVIGNNVNLSRFLIIGSNHEAAAVIGDNTYIAPMVCIVEDVRIGSNVTIGAGSVVTKDIPDNATAAGNYAKVLNYNDPGRYTRNNRWTDLSVE